MPSHYNLRTFLRQLSRELLTQLFESHAIDIGLDVSALKKRQIDPIFAALNALPNDRRHKLDEDFRSIFALATPAGVSQIVDEARFQDFEIIEDLRPITSMLDRAAWTCLHHRAVFDAAARLAVRDLLPGRYWKRRLPVKTLPGADLDGTVKPLEIAISTYYLEQEGRGKACLVEYLRRGSLHYFFAYPEDFPASPLAWTPQGLSPHRYRPAFEVVFVFDDAAGWLDLYCESGKKAVEQLRSLFAETVVALHDLPDRTKPAYLLEGLKGWNFQFLRPPDTPIRDVRLKRLSFAVLGESTKISIDTDPTRDRSAIYREMERVFSTGRVEPRSIALGQTKIIGATLTATIDQLASTLVVGARGRGPSTSPRNRAPSSTRATICCCGKCRLPAALILPAWRLRSMASPRDQRLEDLLAVLTARFGGSSEVATYIGADEWDDTGELAEALVGAGVLSPAEPASALICDGCDQNCVMPVTVTPGINGRPGRAFIVCDQRDDIGRVPVEPARLRPWMFRGGSSEIASPRRTTSTLEASPSAEPPSTRKRASRLKPFWAAAARVACEWLEENGCPAAGAPGRMGKLSRCDATRCRAAALC